MKKTKSRVQLARRCFSLIEILIALSILALISTLVGVKVVDLLRSHRFTSSLKRFYAHVKELQALSLAHGIDTDIYVYNDRGAFFYRCRNDAALSKGALFAEPFELSEVKQVRFNGENCKDFSFLISSSGRIYPSGEISLSSGDELNINKQFILDTKNPFLLHLKRK